MKTRGDEDSGGEIDNLREKELVGETKIKRSNSIRERNFVEVTVQMGIEKDLLVKEKAGK